MMKLETLKHLVIQNRSYRRFNQSVPISSELLTQWIELARYSASARNMQSLRYILLNTPQINQDVFALLKWAGYLTTWDGPEEGQKPSAYIVILNDESLSNNYYCDDGIASQSILLGAAASGFGGCIVAAIDRPKLRQLLQIDEHLKIVHIIALGQPAENIQIDEAGLGADIKYWRDENGVHHVPKRLLNELIIKKTNFGV